MSELKNRNVTIDLLRFLAVLLITNSHFDAMYTSNKWLATGGAIGDALFFFCSGYTLFMGRLGRFDVWYKRRIRRIYPSVLAYGLLALWWFKSDMLLSDLLWYGAGWFVSCIMVYYVFLYFIRKYWIDKLWCAYGVSALVIMGWYLLFFEPMHSMVASNDSIHWMVFCIPMDKTWLYQWNYIKWAVFFPFMLMGAHVGIKEKGENVIKSPSVFSTLIMLILCSVGFYAIPTLSARYPELQSFLIVSVLPLLGVCYYFYRLCETKFAIALMNGGRLTWLISVIGGLCLEIYLVQPLVRTTALNHLFPLNLLIIFMEIALFAYVCRSLGRWLQQTFSSEDGYNWESILK